MVALAATPISSAAHVPLFVMHCLDKTDGDRRAHYVSPSCYLALSHVACSSTTCTAHKQTAHSPFVHLQPVGSSLQVPREALRCVRLARHQPSVLESAHGREASPYVTYIATNLTCTLRLELAALLGHDSTRRLVLRTEHATVMLLTGPPLRLAYAAPPDPPRMP